MNQEHHLIFVPGLGDSNTILEWELGGFKNFGFIPQVHEAPWSDNESFSNKLARLVEKVDYIKDKGGQVSLAGASAGASLAMNTYLACPEDVNGVVIVCGRLRAGIRVFPSLQLAARKHPAFLQSVLDCQSREYYLTQEDKKKILTFCAIFDPIVPHSTSTIEGVTNITVPFPAHSFSIYSTLYFYRRIIANFLSETVRLQSS